MSTYSDELIDSLRQKAESVRDKTEKYQAVEYHNLKKLDESNWDELAIGCGE